MFLPSLCIKDFSRRNPFNDAVMNLICVISFIQQLKQAKADKALFL